MNVKNACITLEHRPGAMPFDGEQVLPAQNSVACQLDQLFKMRGSRHPLQLNSNQLHNELTRVRLLYAWQMERSVESLMKS
ncbi:hypothetical protein T11_11687 [Trichinella zimbabwensis]|uniref:Uncharacterized protein n=1 Tax=Trichinella zimbabwensis TaxID=268475 RepID=A0A0V1HZ42_9BILA|nr:hypothetical protein T11_11687 [Trichinella zimbabwensis]